MKFAVDYFIAGRTACAKITDATKKTACTTAGYAGFKKWGTAIAAGNAYSSLTTAKSTEWFTAEDKKNVAAALALLVPAPGTVGASCKAAAAVAPATVGIRPTCAAANCCMGYKASETATVNSVNGELCQLKTVTKGQVITKAAIAVSVSGYVEVTAQAVTVEQTGACIEGAVRAATAAFSVLTAIYMMV